MEWGVEGNWREDALVAAIRTGANPISADRTARVDVVTMTTAGAADDDEPPYALYRRAVQQGLRELLRALATAGYALPPEVIGEAAYQNPAVAPLLLELFADTIHPNDMLTILNEWEHNARVRRHAADSPLGMAVARLRQLLQERRGKREGRMDGTSTALLPPRFDP
jgi:hypothetical protein